MKRISNEEIEHAVFNGSRSVTYNKRLAERQAIAQAQLEADIASCSEKCRKGWGTNPETCKSCKGGK